MDYRPLGKTGISVSAVAFGAWPISGVTSLDVNERDSLATLEACFGSETKASAGLRPTTSICCTFTRTIPPCRWPNRLQRSAD